MCAGVCVLVCVCWCVCAGVCVLVCVCWCVCAGVCVLVCAHLPLQGFIATLKDGFGFIESEEHDCELFFSFRYSTCLFVCAQSITTLACICTYCYCVG